MTNTCVVYALSMEDQQYRYVGFTRTGVGRRMSSHRSEARKYEGSDGLYAWMRDGGVLNVVCTVLEVMPEGTSDREMGEREKFWISALRGEGFDLYNQTDGGLGVPGATFPGRSGRKWTAEERAAISERVKKQDISHLWTPEAREKKRLAQTGIKHKPHQFKDPARQIDLGAQGAHTRWHAGRNIIKPGCAYCSP